MMQFHKRRGWAWAISPTLVLVLTGAGTSGLQARETEAPAGGQSAASAQAAESAESHEQQIARLIERLGDKEYYVRQQAQTELAKMGFEAFDALTAATAHQDLEIAARARYLLRLMHVEWTAKNDPAEVKRLLTDYESLNMPNKLGRMRALAELPDGAGLPALCRLVRYEKSTVLSKQAAVQLIGRPSVDPPITKPLADKLQTDLEHSRRAASVWLLTWLHFNEDAETAMVDWTKLVDHEQVLLRNAPGETSAEIVAAMVRFQIDWLKRLGRTDKAIAAMYRLLDVEEGDPETLAQLLDWLVEQKAWKVVDELSQRFAAQFKDNAALLYSLAEAQAAQSDEKAAEETAERAHKLNPGKESEQLGSHLTVAYHLRQRGRFAWAEREYRYVIQSGATLQLIVQMARVGLSEMFHDQENDLPAAKLLQDVVDDVKKRKPADDELAGRTLSEVAARMHYFYACHFKSKGDTTQEQENLKKALASDPSDIDSLIASYRLADQSAEQRRKIAEMIKKTASDLQEQINDEPNISTNYNQYAWLIGNTEGDSNLALKYSKKSIELSPDAGGFYDTLAHVYFYRGEYENAVKQQTRAAELEPHSGLILRQLRVFRAKLDEQKQKQRPSPQAPAAEAKAS